MLDFIIWSIDPDIIDLGFPRIRYYGLMFVFTFMFGFSVMKLVFKKENTPETWLDSLLWYMMAATLIGARLGHCLFYEPEYYLSHPLEILKVWEGGLASHGGGIGILVALYLFSRNIAKRNSMWIMDRIVIVVALGAFFIRMGNFFNSEIYGMATNKPVGIVYFQDTKLMHYFDGNEEYAKYFDKLKLKKSEGEPIDDGKAYPVNLELSFSENVSDEKTAEAIIQYRVLPLLHYGVNSEGSESNVYVPDGVKPSFELTKAKGKYNAVVQAYAIPKHPTQLYEAFSYLAIFLVLMYLFFKTNIAQRPGMMFGILLVSVFVARWMIEYVKENQISGEVEMAFNMGQKLSIPFIAAGLIFIVLASLNKTKHWLVKEVED